MNQDLRERLLDAVPPLPTPPDRIEAIGRRYRRRRRRNANAAGLALILLVGAAVGLPQVVKRDGPQPVAVPTACPATTQDRAGRDWIDAGRGVAVPGGPIEVTACDVDGQALQPDPITGAITPLYPRKSPPRVLTGGAEVVAALNSVSTVAACAATSRLRQPVFVVRYADRPPVVVSLNPTCRADDSWDAPVRVFLTGFREQRLRTAPAVPVPACDPTFDFRSLQSLAEPDWAMPLAHGVIVGEPPLPLEPVVTTFCRYGFGTSEPPLQATRQATDDGAAFRAAVNDSPSGEVACLRQVDFTAIDVVKVVDRASVTPTEFRYVRGSGCVHGVHATAAVLTAIDAVQGPID